MAKAKGAMRWAANFVGISAGLHLLALVLGRFSAEALQLLPFAIVYAGFAYGLLQGWRWLAYISFIALLIGTSLAIVGIWALGDVPGWAYTGIVMANLLSATTLFVAL
ncbi:MAG: hypothetical protein AAFN63_08405 [Pseudomonadota bacterium]